MFNTISWHSYWEGLAIITTVYYILIYFICFRKDFAILFSRRTFPHSSDTGMSSGLPTIDTLLEEEQDRAEVSMVYACVDEIKALFEQLKSSKGVKQDILYALKHLLAKYPALITSGYKKSIATVIISQCEHICAIRLSKEEVDHVWMG